MRLEDQIFRCMRDIGRKQILRVAADHQANKPLGVEAGKRAVSGDCAILQDGDVVAKVQDLVEPVRDVENRDSLSRRPRTSRINIATSGAASEDVGSSKMRTRGLMNKALAISTIWRRPRGSWPTGVSGNSIKSELAADLGDRGRQAPVVDRPRRGDRKRRGRYFPRSKDGERDSAPAARRRRRAVRLARRQRRDRRAHLRGSLRCRAVSVPDSRLISVLFPAPFSPSSAWMRPPTSSIETSRSTGLPKKALDTLVCSKDRLPHTHFTAPAFLSRVIARSYFFWLAAMYSSNSFVS